MPITAHAVLDTANATITLPIESYGMSPRELQLSSAARNAAYARCVTGQRNLSPTESQRIKKYLDSPASDGPEWLFGYWDAPYIAAHGWQAGGASSLPLMDADHAAAQRCFQNPDYLAVAAVSVTDGTDEFYRALMDYSLKAHERARRDQRYLRLKADFAACIGRKGYTIDKDDDSASIKSDDSWNSEQETKADIAEATCNDELRLTQQAGDIAASYEQEYIHAHEAELTTIKRESDKHVARAQAILREVGLI